MTPGAMPQNPYPGLRPFKPDEATLFSVAMMRSATRWTG